MSVRSFDIQLANAVAMSDYEGCKKLIAGGLKVLYT